MKRLIIVSAIAIGGLMYQTANAQIGLRFNIHLGARPVYVAPAPVYADADYYYLPDVEAYYSVSQQCYYYQDGGNWISAAYLPGRFHDYDWRQARRFAVNEPRPYMHNEAYRARYGGLQGPRDWGFRDDRSRVYADREHFDHDQNRGHDFNRGQQYVDHSHYEGGFNRQPNDNHYNGGNGQQHNEGGYGRPQQGGSPNNGGAYGQPQQGGSPNGGGNNNHPQQGGSPNNGGNNNHQQGGGSNNGGGHYGGQERQGRI